MMIRLPQDYTVGNAAREFKNAGRISTDLTIVLQELTTHCPNGEDDRHIQCVLDWGYQISFLENMTLSDAISAAMILYFG